MQAGIQNESSRRRDSMRWLRSYVGWSCYPSRAHYAFKTPLKTFSTTRNRLSHSQRLPRKKFEHNEETVPWLLRLLPKNLFVPQRPPKTEIRVAEWLSFDRKTRSKLPGQRDLLNKRDRRHRRRSLRSPILYWQTIADGQNEIRLNFKIWLIVGIC